MEGAHPPTRAVRAAACMEDFFGVLGFFFLRRFEPPGESTRPPWERSSASMYSGVVESAHGLFPGRDPIDLLSVCRLFQPLCGGGAGARGAG